jgi:hypothetical protein
MPRVTPPDAPHRQPRAPPGAVGRERLERVLRARRMEAAPGRQVTADQTPASDRDHQHPRGQGACRRDACLRGRGGCDRSRHGVSRTCRTSVATDDSSTVNSADSTPWSVLKRYSPPSTSSSPTPATAARSRRRIRLRVTAEPAHFPTAYETRGGTAEPSWTNRSVMGPALCRRARARASKLARSRMRQIRRRDASGRAHGGRAARLALRASASGRGSRESCCACDCWAGKCVSNERPPRGGRARSEWGLRAGGDERFSVEAARFQAQRGEIRGVPGPSGAWTQQIPPLVDSAYGCYVARLARLRPGRLRTSPAGPQGLDQADTETTRRGHPTQISGRRACIVHRSPHLWTLLWTEEAGAP